MQPLRKQTVEKKGKSIEEAISAALEELGCEIEQVSIDIVEEPGKGLLGLVKKMALIRATRVDSGEASQEFAVRTALNELLGKMNMEFEIDQIEVEDERVHVNLVGKDKGLLIGRKGETLNALQYIAGLIVNRNRENKIRLILDVESYRKKREQSLEELALRLSDKVKKTKKNVVMRPMNSQERRVVHTFLQNDPVINTFSMGEEPNRKVVISLKK